MNLTYSVKKSTLLFRTFTILIPPSHFFTFYYLLWENSSMTNNEKPISSCPAHFPRPPLTPYSAPLHPLPRTPPQHVITEDYSCIILKHILCKQSPHIGGKEEGLQKHIYNLMVLSTEELSSFINRVSILHKNMTLSRHDVSPNLLIDQVLTQIMACQGFLLLLAPINPIFSVFSINVLVQFSMKKTKLNPSTINLKPPCSLLLLS